MTKQDRQKLLFLVILLAVLAATIVLGYRMNRPPTTVTAQQPEQKTSSNPPAPSDARILLDLVEKPEGGENAGKKNLFQYGQPPAPAITARPALPPGTFTPPGNTPLTQAAVRPGPLIPPPPPSINLKYQGLFTVNSPEGGLVAVLADDSRHYNVKTGEILMGRFRVASISDKQVEIEDLEYNRRQTLPYLK